MQKKQRHNFDSPWKMNKTAGTKVTLNQAGMINSGFKSHFFSHLNLYGIFGNPVSHSLSPDIHNLAFAYTKEPGIYLPFKVTDLPAAVQAIRALDIKGVSITIPHKTSVIKLIDHIDKTALKIGAVNTIVNRNNRLSGFNTDCPAAIEALTEKTSIKGKKAALLGAGGAARAIGFGLISNGARVTIFNRSKDRGEKLASELRADFKPISEFTKHRQFNILINATSAGMAPNTDYRLFDYNMLLSDMTVMDIVYTPLETGLLKAARTAGCKTVDGLSMLIRQALMQFEIWTGNQVPLSIIKQALLKTEPRSS